MHPKTTKATNHTRDGMRMSVNNKIAIGSNPNLKNNATNRINRSQERNKNKKNYPNKFSTI